MFCACLFCESQLLLVYRVSLLNQRCSYGEVLEPSESAINVLLEITRKAGGGEPITMDDWAIRKPTNVADVARVLKSLTSECARHLQYLASADLLVVARLRAVSRNSTTIDSSLFCADFVHEVPDLPAACSATFSSSQSREHGSDHSRSTRA